MSPSSRRSFLAGAGCAAAACAFPDRLLGQSPSLAAIAHDPLRPAYHLLPPHNWMNDPNGPIFWKGKYHLYYQLNPEAAVWGDMHWGHAISTDMVHWHHEPIALAPTPGGPDSEGCFSGSAVVFHGVPTMLYTGVQNAPRDQSTIRDGDNHLRETQLLATAEGDDLLRWRKRAEPVLAAPPAGMDVTGFRDPCPWREEDGWYLGVGSGERGKGGCVLLYRSSDLRHWDYLHKLAEGQWTGKQAANPVDSGEMWECPDFFALGKTTDKRERRVLLYSTQGKSLWTVGHYDRSTHLFKSETEARPLDHGAYYAPKSFLAADGRRILWGWIQETRPQAAYSAAGWAGAMSLPRVLSLDDSGRLAIAPAKETESLRGPLAGAHIRADSPYKLKLPHLRRELRVRAAEPHCTLTVRLAVKGAEVWKLELNGSDSAVRCGDVQFTTAPPHRPAELRIFLDGSVVETFVNTSDALTSRVYSVHPDETEIVVEVAGTGTADVESWPLRAISRDRLTT
ncbi:MAG: glycoside hydrolase family 32 protein [Acidobacteriota bacterium]